MPTVSRGSWAGSLGFRGPWPGRQALELVLSVVKGQETPAVLETPGTPPDRWIRVLAPHSRGPKVQCGSWGLSPASGW